MLFVLISEDYKGQHSVLANELAADSIPFAICKNDEIDININIIQYHPGIVIFNSSKLGYDAAYNICNTMNSNGICEFINIYTYENPMELKKLWDIGVENHYPFPYDPKSMAAQIQMIINRFKPELNEFSQKISDKIDELMYLLNHSRKQRGNLYIRESVMMILFNYHSKPNFHGVIYTQIAQKYNTTVKSVEHSIRITITSCWLPKNKQLLSSFIPSCYFGNKRPTNCCFVKELAAHIARDNNEFFSYYWSHNKNNTGSEQHI